MFAISLNTSCNLNKYIDHEQACVMALVSFNAVGKNHANLLWLLLSFDDDNDQDGCP